MKTYNINLNTGACSTYTGFDFNSACLAEDGNYYILRSDGLCKVDGILDGATAISAHIDMGKQDFGDSHLKALHDAYIGASSGDEIMLSVSTEGVTYDYTARSSSVELQQQRFDTGRGLRANWFGLTVKNTNGCDFEIADISVGVAVSNRRI